MAGKKVSRARLHRAQLAEETLAILRAGRYTHSDGHTVHIEDMLDRAIASTRTLSPGDTPRLRQAPRPETLITVKNETTLQAGRRLVAEGRDVAILNFASAKNPGGGFLGGSQAQEESLARCGGLHPCIDGSPMYAINRAAADPMYTEHMIYSPAVPFFREDDGALLAEPWCCAVVTSPAVNAGVARKRGKSRRKIEEAMRRRIRRVITLAAEAGHDTMVLGAWGCGVFRNDPDEIARLFSEALNGELRGALDLAHFAVYDTVNGRFISAFSEAQMSASIEATVVKPCPSGSAWFPGRTNRATCIPAAPAACASARLSVPNSTRPAGWPSTPAIAV
jgi:uncharacterized protein (TIGR02452 family)